VWRERKTEEAVREWGMKEKKAGLLGEGG